MNKQTFQIPDGCKSVTVEQVGNQIITTFEPVFKRGDVIYCEDRYGFNWVFILKEKINRGFNPYEHFCSITSIGKIKTNDCCRQPERIFRHATSEEAQRLWDALAKEGKRWNPETMQVEPIKKERWRAEKYEVYYCPIDFEGANFGTQENRSIIDDYMFDNGFYCQTPDQSERLFKVIKQVTDKFWEEELI